MTQKDLDKTNHIIFFSQEELDKGYDYCNNIVIKIRGNFPSHSFIGLPDTIAVKELGETAVKEMIEELQKYLDSISKEEDSNE